MPTAHQGALAKEDTRVLDPVERVSEVLFGLIMVLTFTGSLSVATAGRADIREMLYGAIGCNLAWGIVDAVMYVMNRVLSRGRSLVVLRALRQTTDAAHARAVISRAVNPHVASLLRPSVFEIVREDLLKAPEPAARPPLIADDVRGALGVFLLVFLSTFPVVIPFLVFENAQTALRISNAIAVVSLFFCGVIFARHAGLRPWATGIIMVVVGAALVGIAIALGG